MLPYGIYTYLGRYTPPLKFSSVQYDYNELVMCYNEGDNYKSILYLCCVNGCQCFDLAVCCLLAKILNVSQILGIEYRALCIPK